MKYHESVLNLKRRIRNLESAIALDPRHRGHYEAHKTQCAKYILYIEQRGRCCFCHIKMYANSGDGPKDRVATIEHVVPKSEGGADHLKNYALSCSPCNNARGTMDFNEYVKKVEVDGRGARQKFFASGATTNRERNKMRQEKRLQDKIEKYKTNPHYKAAVDRYFVDKPNDPNLKKIMGLVD